MKVAQHFFSTVESKLLDFCNLTIILGGDLYLAPSPQVDKSGKINQPKKKLYSHY